MSRPTILIVARNGTLQKALANSLEEAGCKVGSAHSGDVGVARALEIRPDVVLLEQPLPDGDSLEVCRRIREVFDKREQPIFLMTPAGCASESNGHAISPQQHLLDRVADLDRLAHGVNTLINWTRTSQSRASQIICDALKIDNRTHRATVEDRELPLTPTEFRLLWTLAQRPGHVLSRKQLTDACRGVGAPIQQRTIDVHVKAVRQKLKDHASMIETVRGLGYRLREPRTNCNGQ